VASFLPEGLTAASGRCAVYFAEWQFATETGQEYLDPVGSQYKEAIFLVSAKHEGEPVAYCPFIWVDQDVPLMRGLVQGWPKQIGSVWVSRAYDLPSKASPVVGPSGKFGASLAVKDRRLVDATITLREQTDAAPSPGFAKAFNVRYFPDLAAGSHDRPSVHELVQLRSRNVQFSPIWKGDASLVFFDDRVRTGAEGPAGPEHPDGRQRAREAFEPRWNRWNAIRTACASLASIVLVLLVMSV
jgi:hypothetical protein